MKIEHIAVWTRNLEAAKEFYIKFFGGVAGEKYVNNITNFHSYFISFENGPRLELMQIPNVSSAAGNEEMFYGYSHMAFSAGSREMVNKLTEKLKNHNYKVIREPRHTGDGYYESCILDADYNRIEITE